MFLNLWAYQIKMMEVVGDGGRGYVMPTRFDSEVAVEKCESWKEKQLALRTGER